MSLAARLETIPALEGRVQPAAKLAELQLRNQAPQTTPAAYLVPSGLRGGTPDVVAGMFRQPLDRQTSVILYLRIAGDGTGAAAATALESLIEDVLTTVCGWGPGNAVDGGYRLATGSLIAFQAGLAVYQLDFILDDQLRIPT